MPLTTASGGGSRRRVGALAALLVATFCFATSENLPSGLLPLIAADLGTTLSAVGLLISAYGLTVALVSVPLTRATRGISRRLILTGLLAVFVVATAASGLATSYPVMLTGRILTALAHAVFWAVAVVTATGLFPPRVRGKVVAAVFGASSLATVAGVPLGAWIGVQASWRAAFLVLAGLGLVAMVVAAVTLPDVPSGQEHSARAPEPDRRRFAVLLVATALSITGLSVSTTYTVPFLTDVSGFGEEAVGPLLFLRGAAGALVLLAGAAVLDRWPRASMTVPTWLLGLASIGMGVWAEHRVVTALLLVLFGAAMMLMISAMANRVLLVAPGRTEMAAAAHSSVFNASVALGATVGAVLLTRGVGVRATAVVGGVLLAVGAVTLQWERGSVRARDDAPVPVGMGSVRD